MNTEGTSLAVQWSELCDSTVGSKLIPGWGTKISQAVWHGQKEIIIICNIIILIFKEKLNWNMCSLWLFPYCLLLWVHLLQKDVNLYLFDYLWNSVHIYDIIMGIQH